MRAILAPAAGHDVHVLRVSEVEVTSAIVRQTKTGTITSTDAARLLQQLPYDFANEFFVLEMPDSLIVRACSLVQTHGLRAYDGVQLAGAVGLHDERFSLGHPAATLVSADDELNDAARAENLPVENPNDYP